MSKISDNFMRARKMVQADKAPIPEECKKLILRDLEQLLNDYFLISEEGIQLDASPQNGRYSVKIAFSADRVKNFTSLK